MVSILLEAGGKKMVSERDVASGWSPLHQAACTGSRDCLELLLNNGADPNDTNDDGETPLHLAASNGFDDCVKSLVSNGAVCKVKYIFSIKHVSLIGAQIQRLF